jgi:hypothetical protein
VFTTPVIQRELRVQSRRPATYYTRLAWGLAALFALALGSWDNPKIHNGEYLLSIIHLTFAFMLLLLPPLACADCLSRERRESTLGLLFLTPLTARQLIREKFFSQFLRIASFALLMIPFLLLPLLAGGVTAQKFVLSLTVLATITLVGSASSLVASTVSIRFGVALTRAVLFATLANYIVATALVDTALFCFPPKSAFITTDLLTVTVLGVYLFLLPASMLDFALMAWPSPYSFWVFCVTLPIVSMIFVFLSLRFCAWKISRHAESAIETQRQANFRKKFLTPIIAKKAFRRQMIRRLDTNPFTWLEYRAAWARAARTGAILIVFIIEFVLGASTFHYSGDAIGSQVPLLFLLVSAITLKSATSFHYEKENGAFELILVSPLTESSLVSARLRAVHRFFLPLSGMIIISYLVIVLSSDLRHTFNNPGAFFNLTSLCLSILSVPPVGLFFALRAKHFLSSLFCTAAVAIFGITLLWQGFREMIWYIGYRFLDGANLQSFYATLNELWIPPIFLAVAYHAAIIHFSKRQTIRLLERRDFQF